MIIALAGRRIDAVDSAPPRFPLQNIELVRKRVRAMLEARQATALVSSAACGADLIALSQAGSLGLRRRVVLPFERERFRKSSVTDRPGDWGPLYDKLIDEVDARGDLVVLRDMAEETAYSLANQVILDEAVSLSGALDEPAAVALVWDGLSRGPGDSTEEFGAEARKRGLSVLEIKTI
jgi:hypothetical protein